LALDGRWTDPQLAETTFQPRFGAFDPADGSRHST
jgi:hypothetical protein